MVVTGGEALTLRIISDGSTLGLSCGKTERADTDIFFISTAGFVVLKTKGSPLGLVVVVRFTVPSINTRPS